MLAPMRSSTFLLCFLMAGVLSVPRGSLGAESPSGEEIVAQIQEQARAFEAQYIGSFSKRKATTKIIDPDDDELRSTKDVVLDVWQYHGEHPTRKIHECRFDGKDVDLAKCEEEPRLEPAYRLFADEADEHYRLEYQGVATWDGKASHRIEVVPLEQTSRHLKGDVFFLQDSLLLAGMDVTLADYPFGLQDLSIKMTFTQKDGAPVLDHGRTEAVIYVPFVVNDKSVTEFRATDQKLLTARHAKR